MPQQKGVAALVRQQVDLMNSQDVRIALYSHDTMGLGHVRRNLLLAEALARSPLQAVSLLIAGAREAGAFALPRGVDCLTLPALCKDASAGYRSRCLNIPV